MAPQKQFPAPIHMRCVGFRAADMRLPTGSNMYGETLAKHTMEKMLSDKERALQTFMAAMIAG